MKFHPQKPLHLPEPGNSFELHRDENYLQKKFTDSNGNLKFLRPLTFPPFIQRITELIFKIKSVSSRSGQAYLSRVIQFIEKIRTLGFASTLGEYEKRKLAIFNQLNLLQFFTGLIVPVVVIFTMKGMTGPTAVVLLTPSLTNLLALYLNSRYKNYIAFLSYFILYPFCLSIAYMGGMNLGVDLCFVMNGILAVFFLQELGYIIFCIAFSMINYFILAVVLNFYRYDLETSHPFFYLLNQLLAILFIFYGLYLIKKENNSYQSSLLAKNIELQEMNNEVQAQKEKVAEKVRQLEEQAIQLNEVDAFKNRLFSIVSHDLKSPMYALRNLFIEIKENRIPAAEVKKLIPHVIKDLNYTTGLMDNLLHWAKSQMHAAAVVPQVLNITALVKEIIQQHRLQADLKGIQIDWQLSKPTHIYADRDMVSLVIRNLLSNAIKFTPENGTVSIGTNEMGSHVEIFVTDSGEGMDAETLEKIRTNSYYSTKGTANEPGTGLGLMLCKEFLLKNNGQMHIESLPGNGSTFSFTLPLAG